MNTKQLRALAFSRKVSIMKIHSVWHVFDENNQHLFPAGSDRDLEHRLTALPMPIVAPTPQHPGEVSLVGKSVEEREAIVSAMIGA